LDSIFITHPSASTEGSGARSLERASVFTGSILQFVFRLKFRFKSDGVV
jgi:hypothetical protein